MDWLTITILAIIISALTILWLRIEKRVRAPAIIVVYFPAALLILKWSQFKETWSELGTAALIGIALFLSWWIPIGRNLPPPKGSQIIVITDDDEEE